MFFESRKTFGAGRQDSIDRANSTQYSLLMFWLMASTEVGDIRAGRTTILGPEGGWGATNRLGLTSAWRTLAEIVFKTSTGINMSDLELPCKIWNYLGTSMGCLVWALWTRRQLSWIRILHHTATAQIWSDTVRWCQICQIPICWRAWTHLISMPWTMNAWHSSLVKARCNGAPSNLVKQPERTSNHCG